MDALDAAEPERALLRGVKARIQLGGIDSVRDRLRALSDRLQDAPKHLARDSALIVRAGLRRYAPRKTGAFERSIGFRIVNNVVTFHAASPLARWIIDGTEPHDIWAGVFTGKSDSRALYWLGAAHPVTHVHHPGTKPNDFVEKAVDFSLPAIEELVRSTGEGIFRGL